MRTEARQEHMRKVVERARRYLREGESAGLRSAVRSACATMLFENATEDELREMMEATRR